MYHVLETIHLIKVGLKKLIVKLAQVSIDKTAINLLNLGLRPEKIINFTSFPSGSSKCQRIRVKFDFRRCKFMDETKMSQWGPLAWEMMMKMEMKM